MNHKTIALIVSLFLVTVLLLAAALQTKKPAQDQQQIAQPTPVVSGQAQSTLSLTPNPVTLDANGNGTVNVEISTQENEATGVRLELQYDPQALTNVKVETGPFFTQPIPLYTNIDAQTGKIVYELGVNPSQEPVSGTGVIATVTFSKASGATMNETTLEILQTSLVTGRGIDDSVLKSSSNATVVLSQ